MSITVTLKDEAATIIERQVAQGRYPDAESAVVAALALLEDQIIDPSEIDVSAVRAMIADADAEGGEYTLDEVGQRLDAVIGAARRR